MTVTTICSLFYDTYLFTTYIQHSADMAVSTKCISEIIAKKK